MERIESGSLHVLLPDLVVFQSFFVLTSYYKVTVSEAAEKIHDICQFRGMLMEDKNVILDTLEILINDSIDLVDAWIIAYSKSRKLKGVFSFDRDFSSRGLKLLDIG
jgi:predicted nucleic-acid-binding protein